MFKKIKPLYLIAGAIIVMYGVVMIWLMTDAGI